jgi:hypothetical protein
MLYNLLKALYFGSIMVMVAFSVVMTVVVLNLHHKTLGIQEMNHLVSYKIYIN